MEQSELVGMSPSIASLAGAVVKAQAALKPAPKDSSNPFFNSKYADLSSVWEAIRSAFTSNGLAILQIPGDSDGSTVVLDTLLVHTSGEWVKGRLRMKPVKTDPQGMGSCITYARRYALGAITGLVTEEDDDGNAASRQPAQRREQAGPKPTAASVPLSEPPQALPPPTADEKPWHKGIVTAITQNEKLTRAKKPWGTITLETIEGSTVEATWFGFSHPWSYETIKEQLCGTLLDVEYVLTPANDPKYKPTLEHIRVPQ